MNQVNIPYNTEWKNVAISVSGGADSALLAYMVCDLAKEYNVTIHIINHIRMWKTRPWQQYDADRVYNWLFQRFYHTEFKRHTNFIAPDVEYGNIGPIINDEYGKMVSGDNAQQRSYAEFICHKNNIDAYYNAVTRNPKGVDLGGMKERDIDPTDDNKYLEYMVHMGRVASHPFRFVDKSWIVTQYKKLDIMDLFDITRSCEGEFEDIEYTTYRPGQYVPTCGECFWCKEREWAVEQSK
jgi:hypothetical protein